MLQAARAYTCRAFGEVMAGHPPNCQSHGDGRHLSIVESLPQGALEPVVKAGFSRMKRCQGGEPGAFGARRGLAGRRQASACSLNHKTPILFLFFFLDRLLKTAPEAQISHSRAVETGVGSGLNTMSQLPLVQEACLSLID